MLFEAIASEIQGRGLPTAKCKAGLEVGKMLVKAGHAADRAMMMDRVASTTDTLYSVRLTPRTRSARLVFIVTTTVARRYSSKA